MRDLEAMRIPVLEKRKLLTAKGDLEGVEACNVELRKLNLAIQGVKPYEEEKPVESKGPQRRGKKSAEDVLA